MVTPSHTKGVAGDLAALADRRVLLDLDKRPNFGFISNFTSVQVDELGKFYIPS
jgi:hypothetical protein